MMVFCFVVLWQITRGWYVAGGLFVSVDCVWHAALAGLSLVMSHVTR